MVRTPPAVSLYHRFENDLFGQVLDRLRGAQTVVLPRTPEQRAELARAGGFIVPEQAIDAQSLIAYADLVVSAGGTMNREAVALGTPVFTVFEGRLGAVDERLIAEGRLARLRAPRAGAAGQARRATDPADAAHPRSACGAIRRCWWSCSRGPPGADERVLTWRAGTVAKLLVSDTTLETPHSLGPEGHDSSPRSRTDRGGSLACGRSTWWLVGARRGAGVGHRPALGQHPARL